MNSYGSRENQVRVCGVLEKDFKYIYTSENNERFYESKIINKNSINGMKNIIPLIVPETLIFRSAEGREIEVDGNFKSYSRMGEDGCYHVKHFVLVKEIRFREDNNYNKIYLEGFICKKPELRITSIGNFKTDFIVAINNKDYTSDYIPCMARNEIAVQSNNLELGDKVQIYGFIVSRFYIKNGAEKIAYEVYVKKLFIMGENNRKIDE